MPVVYIHECIHTMGAGMLMVHCTSPPPHLPTPTHPAPHTHTHAASQLAFEREELETEWRKVKGLKKEGAKAKTVIKAVAKGRVW